jgi:hypothetical protein
VIVNLDPILIFKSKEERTAEEDHPGNAPWVTDEFRGYRQISAEYFKERVATRLA